MWVTKLKPKKDKCVLKQKLYSPLFAAFQPVFIPENILLDLHVYSNIRQIGFLA